MNNFLGGSDNRVRRFNLIIFLIYTSPTLFRGYPPAFFWPDNFLVYWLLFGFFLTHTVLLMTISVFKFTKGKIKKIATNSSQYFVTASLIFILGVVVLFYTLVGVQ